MAEDVDPEELQASRSFVQLQQTLGIRTPRKLAELAALSKRIRAVPKSRVKRARK